MTSKFRVYDKVQNQYFRFSMSEKFNVFDMTKDKEHMEYYANVICGNDRYEVEFWSGQSDVDECEIFAGDIVVIDNEYDSTGYPVEWDDCGFWALCGGMDSPLCDFVNSKHLKITGTIHDKENVK